MDVVISIDIVIMIDITFYYDPAINIINRVIQLRLSVKFINRLVLIIIIVIKVLIIII